VSKDKIAEIRVAGMRTLADVKLPLSGLTVLIGENGAGKSSLIEACELLRKITDPNFLQRFNHEHGGLKTLLRFGAPRLTLGTRIDGELGPLDYEIAITSEGSHVVIEREQLAQWPVGHQAGIIPRSLIERTRSGASAYHENRESSGDRPVQVGADQPVLTAFGTQYPNGAMGRMLLALRRIDVQVSFNTTPEWASEEQLPASLRSTVRIEPTEALSRFGGNLANAYSALKNDFGDDHWRDTMELVRLGLGQDVESIGVRVDPGGSRISLTLKYRGSSQQLPLSALSEGQLSYLAFVALYRLNLPRASLFAFDEPETHLHPALLMRVLDFFETASTECPVLLATHSDRLLDGLKEPAGSARLLSLDEERATRIAQPDPQALMQWLERYRGLGNLRSEGYEDTVFITSEQS
jgi:predicted ATPase